VSEAGRDPDRVLPPGQRPAAGFRVLHYGPVPKFRPHTWRLAVNGATADDVRALMALVQGEVAKKFNVKLVPEVELVGDW